MAVAIDIGIAEQDRKDIAEGLSHLLADTYTLYLKTHNFHWNVTGPMFNTLHTMFEALVHSELGTRRSTRSPSGNRAKTFLPPGKAMRGMPIMPRCKEPRAVPAAEEMITASWKRAGDRGPHRPARYGARGGRP